MSFCGKFGEESDWISEYGWFEKLRQYVLAHRISDSEDVEAELLWLFIPDW